MQTWEYHFFQIGHTSERQLQTRLNQLGSEGWELVSVLPTMQGGGTTSVQYTFKRPVEKPRRA